MSTAELPEHELLVSAARVDGTSAMLRFLSEYFPEQDRFGKAFDVELSGCVEPQSLILFLESAKNQNQYVYVELSATGLAVTTDGDEASDWTFTSAYVTETDLNEAELKALIRDLRAAGDRDQVAIVSTRSKLLSARNRIAQQIERIEKKAAGHANTAAGTLYRQQIEFLQRLMADLEH